MIFKVGDIVADGEKYLDTEPTYFLIIDEGETTFTILNLNENPYTTSGLYVVDDNKRNITPKPYLYKWCKKVS